MAASGLPFFLFYIFKAGLTTAQNLAIGT